MSIHVEIVSIATMKKKLIVKKDQLEPLMGWMMMVLLRKEDIPAILLSMIGKYSLMLLYSLSSFSYRCKIHYYIII